MHRGRKLESWILWFIEVLTTRAFERRHNAAELSPGRITTSFNSGSAIAARSKGSFGRKAEVLASSRTVVHFISEIL